MDEHKTQEFLNFSPPSGSLLGLLRNGITLPGFILLWKRPLLIDEAYEALQASIIYYQGLPVGTVAARDPEQVALIRSVLQSRLCYFSSGFLDEG